MSSLSSITPPGARPQSSPTAAAQAGGKAYGLQVAPASGNIPARLPVVDPVTLSSPNVNLTTQSLDRTGELASQTLDAAQKLMDTFVSKLFGDQAKGASVNFDAISLETQSGFAASSTRGADGAVRAASFSLNESASFTGKGQLVTADGQTYDFEIEIEYEATLQASAGQADGAGQANADTAASRSGTDRLSAPDVVVLTGKPLPAIKYPGSLDDLFKLLGKELSGSVRGDDDSKAGDLTLRLQRLVDRAALLAPRQPDESAAAPAERSKAAGSYAAQASNPV